MARGLRPRDGLLLLTLVVSLLGGYFILTGTWSVVPVLGVLSALGLEGVLRQQPSRRLRSRADAALELITPVAALISSVLFFRWVATGYWGVPGAIASAGLFLLACLASLSADDPQADRAALARSIALVISLAGFFGLVAVLYSFELSPAAAAALVGLGTVVFSIETFRPAAATNADLCALSLAAGLAMAPVRWAAAYVRIDGLLAALLLILLFYAGTGLAATAAQHKLDRRVVVEFGSATFVGVLVVLAGRLLVQR